MAHYAVKFRERLYNCPLYKSGITALGNRSKRN